MHAEAFTVTVPQPPPRSGFTDIRGVLHPAVGAASELQSPLSADKASLGPLETLPPESTSDVSRRSPDSCMGSRPKASHSTTRWCAWARGGGADGVGLKGGGGGSSLRAYCFGQCRFSGESWILAVNLRLVLGTSWMRAANSWRYNNTQKHGALRQQ